MASSDDLTQFQLQELADKLGRQGRYLARLCQRMRQRGWKQADLLYARALQARDGVLSLIAGLHEMQKERDAPRVRVVQQAGYTLFAPASGYIDVIGTRSSPTSPSTFNTSNTNFRFTH